MAGPSLAVLGIKVENGDVVKATRSLDSMTVAGSKTEVATQKLTRRMALLEIQAREMDATMGKMHPTVAKLGAAFTAFSALAVVGFIGRKTIEETIAAQNAMAQLEAAVASTGGVAGRTVAQLDALSMSLQRQTTFSDEAVKGAQAMLLTFDKIRGTEFDRATAAVADLATRMGGDLAGAAVQVGKALQDPVTGLTALRRSGVSFSAAQIELIKNLYETGRVAEGQRVILKELEHQFGGSAAAARDTLGGALTGLKNAWGDLFEVTKNGSQGSVDAINAITRALEKSGLSMNQQLTQMTIDWETMKASILKVKAILVTPLSMNWAAEVKAQMDRIEFDLSVAIAKIRSPAKTGPAVGGGAGVLTGDAATVSRDADRARAAAERAEQDRIRAEEKRLRDQEQYVNDIADIWTSGISDIARSTDQGFRAILNSIGNLVGNLIDRMAKEGKSSMALGLAAAAISGGTTGYGIGQSLFSSSHGATGNNIRGAFGGAAGGAAAGFMVAGPVGAAVGALAGLVGGIVGVGSAARQAAKAMAEAVKQVTLSMAALRASVHGETLEGAIAAVEADRAQRAKAIEEAWSGGDANSDRVGWRTQQHKELNALEDERIRQLREEYALAQARAAEDLQVRLLAAQGRDEEARTLALQLAQERERQTLIKSFGESIDPVEAATLALLDQVQAQEKLKAATDAASGSALNLVNGYKGLQSHIFAAMSPRSSAFVGGSEYSGPYTPIDRFAPSSPAVGGDLTATVVMPNGEVLGKAVLRDFQRRKRVGDAEFGNMLS